MDETAVQLYQGGAKGNIFGPRTTVQRISLAKRRQMVSFVAFTCDNAEAQALMPRVVICNTRTLSKRLHADLRKKLPARIELVRKCSAWNDAETLATIIRQLGAKLVRFRPQVPVLTVDACRVHTHPRVLQACSDAGILVVMIPPQMTSIVQPLDVCSLGFNMFKAKLRCEWVRARLTSELDASLPVLLGCVARAMECTLDVQDWSSVFDRLGYGAQQSFVCASVREQLQFDGEFDIGHARPSLDVLATCFPKRTRIREDLLWKVIDGVVVHKRAAARVVRHDMQSLILPPGARRNNVQRVLSEGAKRRRV